MSKVILLCFLLIIQFINVEAQSENGIEFQELPGWQATLSKAKETNKMIFVDIYTTWCGPCKMMDKNVYSDRNVGELINKDFIAVKIQMDSTADDNKYVRSWYADSKKLAIEANIAAYPTFLFYSTNGNLIYKTIGYRDVNSFTKIVTFASDPVRNNFRTELSDYQAGKKDYQKMPDLAKMVRELLDDKKLAFIISKDYKKGYLDKLDNLQLVNKEILKFVNDNGGPALLKLDDRIFSIAYNNPDLVDSVLGKGTSDYFVKAVISEEIINPKLFKSNKPITTNPNWEYLSAIIRKRYPKLKVNDYILDQKISFYKTLGNWDLYTLFKSIQLKINPPAVEGMGLFLGYNVPAWDAFLYCNDSVALNRALEWSNLSIAQARDSREKVQYLDTKANLLYKLGRVKEAIKIENEAIDLAKQNGLDKEGKFAFQDEFLSNIEKMKAGVSTWE